MEASARRSAREADRRQKAKNKQRVLDAAQEIEETYSSYINDIVSLHRRCSKPISWQEKLNDPEPRTPAKVTRRQEIAEHKYRNFKPGLLTKLLKKEQAKKDKLRIAIQTAAEKDEKDYLAQVSDYQSQLEKWKTSTGIAKRILANDPTAYGEAIRIFDPFSGIQHLGFGINFSITDGGDLTADLEVHGEDVIPKEKYTLRQSGSLSTKDMPRSEANSLYQDHICSCVLRVASELFALLPIQRVLINAKSKLVDKSTGHLASQIILSALIVRETISGLNIEAIDPSDAMKNFVCNMRFKKTTGFEIVTPLLNPSKAALVS